MSDDEGLADDLAEKIVELHAALVAGAGDFCLRGGIGLDRPAGTVFTDGDGLDPAATHDLSKTYARAGAEAPPALIQRLIRQMDELTRTGRLPFNGDAEIERLSVVLEADEHYLHRKLERADRRPAGGAAGRLRLRGCMPGRAGLRPDRHVLAAGSFGGSAAGGCRRVPQTGAEEIVEPVSAAMVSLVRNWMPSDAGRRSSARSRTSGEPSCCTRCCRAETNRPWRRSRRSPGAESRMPL